MNETDNPLFADRLFWFKNPASGEWISHTRLSSGATNLVQKSRHGVSGLGCVSPELAGAAVRLVFPKS